MLANSWLTLSFITWTLLMLAACETLGNSAASIPRLVLLVTLVCLLLQLTREMWDSWSQSAELPVTRASADSEKLAAAIAWLVLLLLLTWLLGVAPASSVFCLAWMRGHAGENWKTAISMSAVIGPVLWFLFSGVLGAELFRGVVWTLI